MALLVREKVGFRAKNLTKDRQGHSNPECVYTKQQTENTRHKTERRNKYTIIVGGFNLPLSKINNPTRQKLARIKKNITPSKKVWSQFIEHNTQQQQNIHSFKG